MSFRELFSRFGAPLSRALGGAALLLACCWADVQSSPQITEANVMTELSFAARLTHSDPFNHVTLDAVFTDPDGRELRVPAFWAGTNIWKVRYASPVVGTHHFKTECSDREDPGLHGVSGVVEVRRYRGENPLYQHGPLKVSANRRYLEYADGTPFFWLGDTWWMGLAARLHWPDEFQRLTADRKQKGFNVIQFVAGLFPDMFPFDPRGANEAGYPWETNYTSIRPQYFDAADQRVFYLVEQGFVPCIFGAWGYFMQWMGVQKCEAHWRYLIARYGALPVVWGVAGEANLPWYLAKGFPFDDRSQVADWTEVGRYLSQTDPFHRLMTIHPTGIGRLSARHAINDPNLIDIDMLQTPHGELNAVAPTVNTVRASYGDKPVMPVIDGEASFEMLGDHLPTEWTRRMFWLCLMNGAAGHTYGANGIWQNNRRNDPHGPSPHHHGGFGYGRIPWDEAMHLPGSTQVGVGRKLLEKFAWYRFEPHPAWAEFAPGPGVSLDDCHWIWFPEGDPSKDAPAARRYFRKAFSLPAEADVRSARLFVTVDDASIVWLNGKALGSTASWSSGKEFQNLASFLRSGENVLAIEAQNKPAPSANPAGLLCRAEIEMAGGQTLRIDSDASWACSKEQSPNWTELVRQPAHWQPAKVIARYGEGPWGRIAPPSLTGVYGPQSTGIPGSIRIIYVPESQPIIVRNIESGNLYSAKLFDPVSGSIREIGPVRPDASGSWSCPPPAEMDHDWVLVLTRKS